MKITIIGTGYVGLVSAACFAKVGHTVTCLDVDHVKISLLNEGKIPIYEPGLEGIVSSSFANQNLFFTIDPAVAFKDLDIAFLAVPTQSAKTGEADLRHLFSALDTLSTYLNKKTLIVIKSTVPVGTTIKAKTYLKEALHHKGKSFSCDVAFNPEFLKEGCAIKDFMKPDRIIFGSTDQESINLLKNIYAPFHLEDEKTLIMKPSSAEMTKYAANVMLASRISLMNEFANFCEKVDADIEDVKIGIGSDPRIGPQFLNAGIGFGGSCFPKDIRALKALMHENHLNCPMIEAIETVNHNQKNILYKKLKAHFEKLDGKTFTLLGLAFKPDTDDIREASALSLIDSLLQHDLQLNLYDPIASKRIQKQYGSKQTLLYFDDPYSALKNSDGLLLITEWKEFQNLDFNQINQLMKTKAVFDGRNLFQRETLEKLGFFYSGIGT